MLYGLACILTVNILSYIGIYPMSDFADSFDKMTEAPLPSGQEKMWNPGMTFPGNLASSREIFTDFLKKN